MHHRGETTSGRARRGVQTDDPPRPRATRVWTGPLGDPPPVTAFGPHHGVLPLALEPLSRIGLDGRAWAELSPLLEGMLDGRLGSASSGELSSTLVKGVARAARAAGVRTYAESLRTALDSSGDGRLSGAEHRVEQTGEALVQLVAAELDVLAHALSALCSEPGVVQRLEVMTGRRLGHGQ